MSGDVVLTAALRNNLLSLQGTQGLIDTTQFRLATGKKVNSALDNPQNFFASQALTNRSSDLSRLLDGLGQSIQTIKAADNAITALTKLVEQADSIVQSARDAVAQGSTEAKVVGNVDLRGVTDLTAGSFASAGLGNGDVLSFTVTDPEDSTTPVINAQSVTIATGDSIEQLITKINDLNPATGDAVLHAELNDSGQLSIRTLNGGKLRVDFQTNGAADGSAAVELATAQVLGFGNIVGVEQVVGTANVRVAFTAESNAAIESAVLTRNATGDIARLSDSISSLYGDGSQFTGVDNNGDTLQLTINGTTASSAYNLNTGTIQGLIDAINNDANIGDLVDASYDETTGRLSIRAIDSSVQTVEFTANSNTNALDLAFGFGAGTIDAAIATGTDASEFVRFGSAAAELASLEGEFENVRTQIDGLVDDAGYRGTNLLNGDDLNSYFNEDRSNKLTTQGVTFTASGLGIDAANFANATTIDAAGDAVRTALTSVRNFGSSLANDLSIIQTREDFTKSTINTLNEGADKLTLADQNEEGAKLLALQTRQQLGVTSLALASQSAQSVLRLF